MVGTPSALQHHPERVTFQAIADRGQSEPSRAPSRRLQKRVTRWSQTNRPCRSHDGIHQRSLDRTEQALRLHNPTLTPEGCGCSAGSHPPVRAQPGRATSFYSPASSFPRLPWNRCRAQRGPVRRRSGDRVARVACLRPGPWLNAAPDQPIRGLRAATPVSGRSTTGGARALLGASSDRLQVVVRCVGHAVPSRCDTLAEAEVRSAQSSAMRGSGS